MQDFQNFQRKFTNIVNCKIWSKKENRFNNKSTVIFNLFDKLGENENTINFSNSFTRNRKSTKFHVNFGSTYTQLVEQADYKRFFIEVYDNKGIDDHLDVLKEIEAAYDEK